MKNSITLPNNTKSDSLVMILNQSESNTIQNGLMIIHLEREAITSISILTADTNALVDRTFITKVTTRHSTLCIMNMKLYPKNRNTIRISNAHQKDVTEPRPQ